MTPYYTNSTHGSNMPRCGDAKVVACNNEIAKVRARFDKQLTHLFTVPREPCRRVRKVGQAAGHARRARRVVVCCAGHSRGRARREAQDGHQAVYSEKGGRGTLAAA